MKQLFIRLIAFLKNLFSSVKTQIDLIDANTPVDPAPQLRIEIPKRKMPDKEWREVTKRIREVVGKIDSDTTSYWNDPIKDGRSLKWYGRGLASKLRRSKKFDKLVDELRAEGYTVIVRTTQGMANSPGATRVQVRRKKNDNS